MAKILSIIPYEFFPPKYGGALRCFYLLREMARYHEVVLLTVQIAEDFKGNENLFPENVRVISIHEAMGYKSIFNIFPERLANAINGRILRRSLLKRSNLFILKLFPTLKEILTKEHFDIVNYENLECFSWLREFVVRYSPSSLHLYDAHNVDSVLWEKQAEISKLKSHLSYAKGAREQEAKLYKSTDICFCCSEVDKKKFLDLNNGKGNFVVIPNGVNTDERKFDMRQDKFKIQNILFCGTLDYGPNIEGVLWFYTKVFPLVKEKLPEIKLTIIGKINTPFPVSTINSDPNVDFIGYVRDVVPYYLNNSVSIVPLLGGSGTRLKILEAMSMGNPVVSTQIGAEGLEVVHKRDLWIADTEVEFAGAIIELLQNPESFNEIRINARKIIEQQYDWEIIGKKVNKALGNEN